MANLEGLIEDGVMKYDGYEGTTIGSLTVVGWNGKYGNPKKYIVTCNVCSSDTELHQEGYFAIAKGHLIRGCKPCGCSDKSNWTENQYKVRIKRVCDSVGLIFNGWIGKFSTANKTLVDADCPEHGKIGRTSISSMLDNKFVKSCRDCFALRMGNSKRKDDQVMVDLFNSSGLYPEGTVFRRSDRLDKNGHKKYWFIYCPICNTTAEGHIVGIYKGSKSCECSYQTPKETYINLIKDYDTTVAIKFGVANNSSLRLKEKISSRLVYTLWFLTVFGYIRTPISAKLLKELACTP